MPRRFSLAFIVLGLLATAYAASDHLLLIKHVNVIDVVTGKVQPDMTVTIEDGKIADIRQSRKKDGAGNDAIIVEAADKFLIPGLWDMHAHFEDPQREFKIYVANGVLGVRNMGGVAKEVFRWREEIATGKVLGPKIVACGPIVDGPNPANPPISVSVKDAETGRQMVRTLKEMGADCVKVYDGVPLEAYVAMADEAKKAGLPLVGHVPLAVPTFLATNSGQRSIEHQVGLRGASTAEDEVMRAEKQNNTFAEAMRTKNFGLIPESIAKRGNEILDHFSNERAHELYRAFVRNGTYLCPTLVTDRALTFVDDFTKQNDPRLKYITPSMQNWWKPENGMLTRYRTPAYIAYRKRQFAKTLEQIPRAHRDGVTFLAGTDAYVPYTYPGFSVHDEMGIFVQAGLTPLEALQTATINPARFFGGEASTGSVQKGKVADLVLLEADPLKDISNTKKIFAVVVKGKLLRRSNLDQMLKEAEVH